MNKYSELIEKINILIEEVLTEYTSINERLEEITKVKEEKNKEIKELRLKSDQKNKLIQFLLNYKKDHKDDIKNFFGVSFSSSVILSLILGTIFFKEMGPLAIDYIANIIGGSLAVSCIANGIIHLNITKKDRKKYKENIKNLGIIDMERKGYDLNINYNQKQIMDLDLEEQTLLNSKKELMDNLTTLKQFYTIFKERLAGIELCLNNDEKINNIFDNDYMVEEAFAIELIRRKNN